MILSNEAEKLSNPTLARKRGPKSHSVTSKLPSHLIMILELDPVPPGGDHGRCPIRGVLDCIGDRWSVLTLAALSRGTLRFTEVRRVIGHVSQRVLAQTLRKLERDGYVRRKVYPTVPPKVEYSLTPLGRSLVSELKVLVDWAKENGTRVIKAREAYIPPVAAVAL